MPVLQCYVSDEDFATLKEAATKHSPMTHPTDEDLKDIITEFAENAISEACLPYRKDKSKCSPPLPL